MPDENQLWRDLYEAEAKRAAKANFTVGWLSACLREHRSAEEVANQLSKAQNRATEIFG
jgi:hypothetical protein